MVIRSIYLVQLISVCIHFLPVMRSFVAREISRRYSPIHIGLLIFFYLSDGDSVDLFGAINFSIM